MLLCPKTMTSSLFRNSNSFYTASYSNYEMRYFCKKRQTLDQNVHKPHGRNKHLKLLRSFPVFLLPVTTDTSKRGINVSQLFITRYVNC